MATTVVTEGEHEEGHESESAERAIGRLESDVEHAEERLEEHAGEITSLKGLHEWIQTQLDDLRRTVTELPIAPAAETMNAIFDRLGKLEEKVLKPIEESAESSTAPPERETEQEAEKATHSIRDRLASIL